MLQDSTHHNMFRKLDNEQFLAEMTEENLTITVSEQELAFANVRTQDLPVADQSISLIQQDRQILTGQRTTSMTVNDGEASVSTSKWSGYKIVGDNIDKNSRPTFQCHDNKTTSFHAFHMYAVKDRIDCSAFSDTPGTVDDASKVDVSKVLINDEDIKQLNKDLEVLISRYGIVFVYHRYST